MKTLLAIVMCLGLSHAATAAEPWLAGIPATWPTGVVQQPLPESTFVELPTSMHEVAEQELRDHAAVRQPNYAPETYHRPDLVCPKGTAPYLLRAVYTNGGTGAYSLYRIGQALWVSHQSLGRSTGMHRSALLACLSFEPAQVYVTASGAM